MKNKWLPPVLGALLLISSVNAFCAESTKKDFSKLTTEEIAVYQDGKIDLGWRLLGGGVGTFVGFGLGHIFIGKYSEMGWVFTVGEFGSLVVAVAGAATYATSIANGSNSGGGLLILGIVGFYGFRIWEIVDVWARPERHNRKWKAIRARVEDTEEPETRRPNFGIIPVASREGNLGLGLSFAF